MLLQVGLGVETRIVDQILTAQHFGDELIILYVVLRHSQLEPAAIAGLVGHVQLVGNLIAADGELGGRIAVLSSLQEQRDIPDAAMEQADHHLVALSSRLGTKQSGQNAAGQIHADLMVTKARDRSHGDGRSVIHRAHDASTCEVSGKVKTRQILIRAFLTITTDKAHDQRGILCVQGLIIQTSAFQRVLTPVGDKDIGLCNQLFHGLAPGGSPLGDSTLITSAPRSAR